MKKAIFLDRDGTLNYSLKKKNSNKVRPPYKISELKFYEDIHELKKYTKEIELINDELFRKIAPYLRL